MAAYDPCGGEKPTLVIPIPIPIPGFQLQLIPLVRTCGLWVGVCAWSVKHGRSRAVSHAHALPAPPSALVRVVGVLIKSRKVRPQCAPLLVAVPGWG